MFAFPSFVCYRVSTKGNRPDHQTRKVLNYPTLRGISNHAELYFATRITGVQLRIQC